VASDGGTIQNTLAAQVAGLSSDSLAKWQAHRVPPFRVPYHGFAGSRPEVLVIARNGNSVLIYDELEDEFGVCTLDPDGLIHEYGTLGENLNWSLERFPK
jgi:hypothetical protein